MFGLLMGAFLGFALVGVPVFFAMGLASLVFIALSAGVAVLVSTLAALIPARNTSKLNPIEVIRNA